MSRSPVFIPPQDSFAGATVVYVDGRIATRAPLASPALTGTPTAPTATANTNSTQIATTAYVDAAMPVGSIIMFGGTAAPAGWHLCDGTVHGSSLLQAVLGTTTTPDLRDKFVVGAGSSYARGATGGAATVTLTGQQSGLRAHGHGTIASSNDDTDHTHSGTTGAMSANSTHVHSVTGTTDTEAAHTHNVTVNEGTPGTGADGFYVDTENTGDASDDQTVGTTTAGGAHAHTISGTAAASSIAHTHTFTSGGRSAYHQHTVAIGTSSATPLDAVTQAHENRPPYYALTYIIKK